MAEGVGDHALARDRGLPHCSGQRRPGRVSALEHQWARPAHEGGRHVRQRAACLRLRFQVVTNPAIYYYYLLTSTNGSLAWMSWWSTARMASCLATMFSWPSSWGFGSKIFQRIPASWRQELVFSAKSRSSRSCDGGRVGAWSRPPYWRHFYRAFWQRFDNYTLWETSFDC